MFGVGVGVRVGGQRFGSGVAPYVGLLDSYPGAAAAYSVRLLKSDYTGNAIRVRRSSDNAEQNIGFSGGNLDTTALTSFCSGTNGFVTTWYDQSGNGNNATATTAIEQPQIVASGLVITNGGKPALQFDNTNDNLTTNLTVNRPYSIYAQFLQKSYGDIRMMNSSTNVANSVISSSRAANTVFTEGDVVTSAYASANQNVIISLIESVGTSNFYYNNSNITNGTGNANFGVLCFGRSPVFAERANGEIKEAVVYLSDKTTINTAIHNNMNTYYGIY